MSGYKPISSVFISILGRLISQSENTLSCLRDGGRRRWDMFNHESGDTLEAYDMFDGDDLHELFDRSEVTDNYIKSHTNEVGTQPFTAGDVEQAKIQADFLAGCERDFRARTMTRIRTMAHEAVRQRKRSSDEYRDEVLSWVVDKTADKQKYDDI
jgi:hypothetical protein